MKRILSLITILALSFTVATAAEPINFDAQNIDSEFEQLNKIEKFVINNEGTTLDNLKSQNSELLSNINIEADSASVVASSDLPAGIPAFWWGCVLTILGVVLVYVLTDKDNAQTKKALLGCLVSGGIYIIWWIVVASIGTRGFF
jgi:cytochrome c biogenesis protein CcdA